MHRFSLTHLSDAAVREGMKSCRARERSATAALVAHIAEAEGRRLYLEDACDSMATYCTRELGFSDDEAYKRIHAGRAATRFPEIFAMLEDGRLHLTGVNLLAPKLTEANAEDLLALASEKSVFEIRELLAARFPQTEPLPLVLATVPRNDQLVSKRVAGDAAPTQLIPERVEEPRSAMAPHAARRFTATVAMDQTTHDELRECADLLGHVLPSGNVGDVIAFAVHHLVVHLRKRKFAATSRAARPKASSDPRHIPAQVRRAVCERDRGRCTFMADDGRRCDSRQRLEFDHEIPVARGGESTVDNLRLRCRAHNQYEAERVFGQQFMERRREESVADAERARAEAAAKQLHADALAALLALGYRRAQALAAIDRCGPPPVGFTLEQRVKQALQQLLPPHRRLSRDDLSRMFASDASAAPAHAPA